MFIIFFLTSHTPNAQECRAAFQITGRKPPPGQCNQDNDSECCAPGQNYTAYWCSPPVTNRTEGVLNLSGFEEGQDGGSTGECDGKYHSDATLVVALSTGWYDFGSRCGHLINISGNGRSVLAAVVDECNSYSGCDAQNSYQPPCPHNVLSASKAVWAALGVPEGSPMHGEMNVTWAPTNRKVDLTGDGSDRRKTALIAAPIAAAALAAAMVALTVFYIKKRRRQWKELLADEEWESSSELLSDLPKRFTYNELMAATNNFDRGKMLGAGSFGCVFEGTLNDNNGTRVAIKRLNYIKQAGKKEFLTEVKTTGNTHHFNLVKLVGFCAEREPHRLLVYEHMVNNSLDKWILRDKNPNYSLPWGIRKKIILHIAKGLSYLHEDCQSKIIHLDIKPQNILLDREFNAKLADFGLAKLMEREESFAATQMRGTRGYLAPEWLSKKITEKVDVYSYGIVVLEVVFQRRNFNVQCQENPTLVEIVTEKMEEEGEHLLDGAVHEWFGNDEEMTCNGEEVGKTIKLAIWCLQSEPTRRPSMSTVVKVLEGATLSPSSSLEPRFDSTCKDSPMAATTSGEFSSNATFEMSSMPYPR
ncbi:unnamed protein product [Cuscuta campestris]|uniref:non-specific serine/threonine protein kinase n=1 Tax=Cuscuta campestris TaxID=132261 RepID=A0A484LU96_9ASTE|nr:unnamed protein product [Cuscuta campestris]